MVDCGAYDGDTISSFVKYYGDYSQIYAFEPNSSNYLKMISQDFIKASKNITCINKAVGNYNGIVSFSMTQNSGTCVDEQSNSKIEIVRLDDAITERVSMIKMDIEGEELNALNGTSEIIRKFSPKLAICVYHNLCDIFEIPQYVKAINSNYRFRIRQHDPSMYETVLYAWV